MAFLWETFLGKIIMTFLISMVPVVELRGAIPMAAAHGLSLWIAYPTAIIGNLFPAPFIILFIRQIFTWIRRVIPRLDRLIGKLEARAEKKSATVQKYAFWGLFLLVAVPLPGTGAWTGALVAAMMEMRLKRALPAITLGVITAGIIMVLLSLGVKSFI